jgi:hypothetical protein
VGTTGLDPARVITVDSERLGQFLFLAKPITERNHVPLGRRKPWLLSHDCEALTDGAFVTCSQINAEESIIAIDVLHSFDDVLMRGRASSR